MPLFLTLSPEGRGEGEGNARTEDRVLQSFLFGKSGKERSETRYSFRGAVSLHGGHLAYEAFPPIRFSTQTTTLSAMLSAQ